LTTSKKNLLKNIDARETKWGTVYRVRLRIKGETYSATRDSLVEAINWRDQTEALLRAGMPLPGETPQGEMSFEDASDKYISSASDRSRSTLSMYRFAQAQILNYFDDKILLSKITPLMIHEFINHRRNNDHVGASKIYQELSFIRMVYQAAAGWGLEVISPEINIKRPKRKIASREDRLNRVIQPEEMSSFLAKVHEYRPDLYFYLVFLLYSGMRPTEAATLRWKRMPGKEEKKSIREKRHTGYIHLKRGGFSRIGTKTIPRFVPIHPVTLRLLNILEKERKAGKIFVFLPDNHGQKDRPYQHFRRVFRRARRDTVLPDGDKLRDDIDFYSFRHTARSRMAVCGIQDSAAETIIGHESDRMTNIYTHYEDHDLVREIARLDYPWLELLF